MADLKISELNALGPLESVNVDNDIFAIAKNLGSEGNRKYTLREVWDSFKADNANPFPQYVLDTEDKVTLIPWDMTPPACNVTFTGTNAPLYGGLPADITGQVMSKTITDAGEYDNYMGLADPIPFWTDGIMRLVEGRTTTFTGTPGQGQNSIVIATDTGKILLAGWIGSAWTFRLMSGGSYVGTPGFGTTFNITDIPAIAVDPVTRNCYAYLNGEQITTGVFAPRGLAEGFLTGANVIVLGDLEFQSVGSSDIEVITSFANWNYTYPAQYADWCGINGASLPVTATAGSFVNVTNYGVYNGYYSNLGDVGIVMADATSIVWLPYSLNDFFTSPNPLPQYLTIDDAELLYLTTTIADEMYLPLNQSVIEYTTSRTSITSDLGKLIRYNSLSDVTYTIEQEETIWPEGAKIQICQYNIGSVSIAILEDDGTMVSTLGSIATTNEIYSLVTIQKIVHGVTRGDDVFLLTGELLQTVPNDGTHSIDVICGDETTALTVGTNKVTFHAPYDFKITDILGGLSTPQSAGSILTVDVNVNNVSILNTLLTIDNAQETSQFATTLPVISSAFISKGSKITIDIDQVGDGSAKGLKVYLIGVKMLDQLS